MTRILLAIGRVLATAWLLMATTPLSHADPLKVMTFNVWSGENSSAGRQKLAEIIAASDADIVGLQEMGSAAGQEIAGILGMHFHQQSSGGLQILSRLPILGQSSSNRGVRFSLGNGSEAWLFNAHLAAYPYQPYDLRDGVLPMDEAAVIAAANAARGSTIDSYLAEMQSIISSGATVFLTGDFNEPSHLDWTAAAAAATARPFDLEVAYPTSSKIVAAGMTDSFRAVRPDVINDRGYTWTPGYPPPILSANEVHDRIDLVYHSGTGVSATAAYTLGIDANNSNTDIEVPGYNSDHRAVVVEYDLQVCSLWADLNGDCELDAADWNILRNNQRVDMSGLTALQAFALGDLNGDFQNDFFDFRLFRQAYEQRNGADSFASLSQGIPEPSSYVMALLGLLFVAQSRRRLLR